MDFQQADTLNEAIRAIGIRHRALSIAALAPFGIHPGHKLLLFELEARGPRTQAQLADACGYEPPTITLSVRQLEAADLVVRRPSSSDRRANVVELSDRGRRLLPEVKAAWRHLAEETIAGLNSTGFDTLLDVLTDLADGLAAGDVGAEDIPNWVARRNTRR
ncbi:MAG: MarR family winged helix-turn-helix transcriptional regulator [Candidatus Dormiibacterota bacterium]